MSAAVVHEHEILARLIEGAALVAHGTDCELCGRLGVRRQLDGLAEQIRSVNNTPHPKSPASPTPPPTNPPKGK